MSDVSHIRGIGPVPDWPREHGPKASLKREMQPNLLHCLASEANLSGNAYWR